MATDDDEMDRAALVDRIKRRVDDLEEEIGDDLDRGRGRLEELTVSIRKRVEVLRRRDSDADAEGAVVDEIRSDVDELESEITDADETDRVAVSGIVRDIKDRLAELERRVRRQ